MNSTNAAIAVETSPSQELDGEGPLACYTTASCPNLSGPVASATCVGPGVLRFVLHAAPGDRVTRVTVYLDGRLVLRRHGRRIRTVRVSVPSAGAKLRIVTISQRGTRRTSTRRITGCRKGAPKTVVTHRASRR
jgi:hypothetical protein